MEEKKRKKGKKIERESVCVCVCVFVHMPLRISDKKLKEDFLLPVQALIFIVYILASKMISLGPKIRCSPLSEDKQNANWQRPLLF